MTYVGLCNVRIVRAGPAKDGRRGRLAASSPGVLCLIFHRANATMADNDARPAAAAAADDDDNSDVEMSGECYDGLRVRFGV